MTAQRMIHAIERERALKHKVRGGRECGGRRHCDEHVPTAPSTESEKRWHEAQARLNCQHYACPDFLDALPALICQKSGKDLCLQSWPDMLEIAEICPYSGKKEAIAKR